MTPTTAAGRALHEALRRGAVFVRSWDAEGKDYPDYAGPKIAAIEAEARQQERERIRAEWRAIQESIPPIYTVREAFYALNRLDAILADEPRPYEGRDIDLEPFQNGPDTVI